MEQMIWKLNKIEKYIPYINELFEKNRGHKHEDNYLKNPLFEYTKFARMGWDNYDNMVYYSAAVEIPEYNGSIRIMSRHTRDRNYDFGGWKADLKRGTTTLDLSAEKCLDMGYKNIWVSREESPNLFKAFQKMSKYNWNITYEQLHYGGMQYVLRINNDKIFR